MDRKSSDFFIAIAGIFVAALLLTWVARSLVAADPLEQFRRTVIAIANLPDSAGWDDNETYADDQFATMAVPLPYEQSYNAWSPGTTEPTLITPVVSDHYPAMAARNGWEGSAVVHFAVDDTGEPFDCRMGESSGYDVLDKASCLLILTKAKYSPARDMDGLAVMSGAHMRITWRLED